MKWRRTQMIKMHYLPMSIPFLHPTIITFLHTLNSLNFHKLQRWEPRYLLISIFICMYMVLEVYIQLNYIYISKFKPIAPSLTSEELFALLSDGQQQQQQLADAYSFPLLQQPQLQQHFIRQSFDHLKPIQVTTNHMHIYTSPWSYYLILTLIEMHFKRTHILLGV